MDLTKLNKDTYELLKELVKLGVDNIERTSQALEPAISTAEDLIETIKSLPEVVLESGEAMVAFQRQEDNEAAKIEIYKKGHNPVKVKNPDITMTLEDTFNKCNEKVELYKRLQKVNENKDIILNMFAAIDEAAEAAEKRGEVFFTQTEN